MIKPCTCGYDRDPGRPERPNPTCPQHGQAGHGGVCAGCARSRHDHCAVTQNWTGAGAHRLCGCFGQSPQLTGHREAAGRWAEATE